MWLNPRGMRLMQNHGKNQTPIVLGCEAVQLLGITCTWMDMRNTAEDPKGNNHS